jgi:hypothetical protein
MHIAMSEQEVVTAPLTSESVEASPVAEAVITASDSANEESVADSVSSEEEMMGDEEGGEEEWEDESRLRIVEGGLNFVLKNFGEDLGDFYGLIISYDEPFFKVCIPCLLFMRIKTFAMRCNE